MTKAISKADAAYAQYAIDCAERVLPFLTGETGGMALAAARDVLAGKPTGFNRMMFNAIRRHHRQGSIASVITAIESCAAALDAAYAASGADGEATVQALAYRAANYAKNAIWFQSADLAAHDSEREWQQNRLRELLED